MIIVYTPDDGGEPEQYDARLLLTAEASMLQKVIDQTWADIKGGLWDEDIDGMRGIVWILKKRTTPELRFSDFNPPVDSMVTRMDRREIEDYVAEAVANLREVTPDVTLEQLAFALRKIPSGAADPEHARRVVEEATAARGKDEAPPGGARPTGSRARS